MEDREYPSNEPAACVRPQIHGAIFPDEVTELRTANFDH